ncbi:MAG: hypothetical protein ACT4ON_01810 [Bacteroidota bacterium]
MNKKYLSIIRISLFLTIILLNLSFYSGSNTAVLTCKSNSGKTTFVAYIQDITSTFEGATFTMDKSSIEFDSNENGYVVLDSKSGVFTLFVDGRKTFDYPNGKFIRFWAIPSTFKIITEEHGHKVYEFKAKLNGTDPRPNKTPDSPVVELNCKLEWKI